MLGLYEILCYIFTFMVKVSIYVYMRMTYLALYFRIKGDRTHKYAKDIELYFDGCNPIMWSDSKFNYVSGLPAHAHKGKIVIENKSADKKFHFDSHHGIINWENFFENIPSVIYYDDMD